jgi:hypothetical protein
MTEPKPTRFLSQRLLGWAEGKAEEIRAALVAADDAHDVFVPCDGKCITADEVGVIADGMYAVDPECTLHGKEGQ